MMELVPVGLLAFKLLVLGTGMFFAVKWHYDKEKKKDNDVRTVLRTSAIVAAVFVLLAIGLVFATFAFARSLGMDLSLT